MPYVGTACSCLHHGGSAPSGVLSLFHCNREANILLHRLKWQQVVIGLSPEVVLLLMMETGGSTCDLSFLRLFVAVLQKVAVKPVAELMEKLGKAPL